MRLVDADEMFWRFAEKGQESTRYQIGQNWELNGAEIREVIDSLPTIKETNVEELITEKVIDSIRTIRAFCRSFGDSTKDCVKCPCYNKALHSCAVMKYYPSSWNVNWFIQQINCMDKPTYCSDCAHYKVCGSEGIDDPSMTYCADKLVLDKEKC